VDNKNQLAAKELLRVAKLLTGKAWKEFDDKLGHRWAKDEGDHVWHITEIEGPGIPLYRLMLNHDEYGVLKLRKQLKSLRDAQGMATDYTKQLKGDGSIIFTKFVKASERERRASGIKRQASARPRIAKKGEVPEAFKKEWKNKDKDGDGKENEPKPDFLKKKGGVALKASNKSLEELLELASDIAKEAQMLVGRSLILWQDLRDSSRVEGGNEKNKAEREAKSLHKACKDSNSIASDVMIALMDVSEFRGR